MLIRFVDDDDAHDAHDATTDFESQSRGCRNEDGGIWKDGEKKKKKKKKRKKKQVLLPPFFFSCECVDILGIKRSARAIRLHHTQHVRSFVNLLLPLTDSTFKVSHSVESVDGERL